MKQLLITVFIIGALAAARFVFSPNLDISMTAAEQSEFALAEQEYATSLREIERLRDQLAKAESQMMKLEYAISEFRRKSALHQEVANLCSPTYQQPCQNNLLPIDFETNLPEPSLPIDSNQAFENGSTFVTFETNYWLEQK